MTLLLAIQRQSGNAHSPFVHDANRTAQDIRLDFLQNKRKQAAHFPIRVIPSSEKDHAWAIRGSERQQTREIQIGRYNRPAFVAGQLHEVRIGSAVFAYLVSMNPLVSVRLEHLEQRGGNRHIEEEFHLANSTTSSSASRAA